MTWPHPRPTKSESLAFSKVLQTTPMCSLGWEPPRGLARSWWVTSSTLNAASHKHFWVVTSCWAIYTILMTALWGRCDAHSISQMGKVGLGRAKWQTQDYKTSILSPDWILNHCTLCCFFCGGHAPSNLSDQLIHFFFCSEKNVSVGETGRVHSNRPSLKRT